MSWFISQPTSAVFAETGQRPFQRVVCQSDLAVPLTHSTSVQCPAKLQ